MDTIRLYNSRQNPSDELEIIISDNKDFIINLIKPLNPFVVHKYIDLYVGRNRMRIFVSDPNKEPEKINKIVINSEYINIGVNLKINLKEERKTPDFDIKSIDKIRIKYVQSYKLDDWILDISKTVELGPEEKGALAEYKHFLVQANNLESKHLKIFNLYSAELEHVSKKSLTLETLISKVQELLGPIEKKVLVYDGLIFVANIRAKHGLRHGDLNLKELLPNPVILEKNIYKDIYKQMDDWFICEKTDGERSMLVVFTNRYFLIKKDPEISSHLEPEDTETPYLIVDGEYHGSTLYAFDILYYNEDLCAKSYKERLDILMSITSFPIDVVIKNILPLSKDNIKNVHDGDYPYKIDGFILTKNCSYFGVINEPHIYKWKPVDELSIDFLVLKGKTGNKPQPGLFNLYVTISKKSLDKISVKYEETGLLTKKNVPIKFSTPRRAGLFIFQTNDKNLIASFNTPVIAEFRYDLNNETWIFMRIREDRQALLESGNYFGNNYFIAHQIMEQYYHPLTIHDLLDYKNDSYFKEEKSSIYKKINGVSSAIKANIFAQGKGKLIDLAAGKGQDISRYKKGNFSDVLAIDIDNDALTELMNRNRSVEGKIDLQVLNLDLTACFKKSKSNPMSKYANWANMVTINFAIHYIIKTINDINSFAWLISAILAEGGLFAFTCLNGKKVKKALDESDINIYEKDILKFSIRSVEKNKEITLNKVDVLLPFSQGQYYRENLVDVDKIIKVFEEWDFSLRESEGFDNYFHTLNEIDKSYCTFNHYVILQKNNE